MIFNYPYHTPLMNEGVQIHTPGQGGPQSNLQATAAHAQSWPGMSGHLNALFVGPSFQRQRPQMPVVNQLNSAGLFVEIPGLTKTPTYD